MINDPYPFDQTKASSYRFTSLGRKQVTKEVVFTHTGYMNIVNMGFGDVLPDGSIDDKAISNNGDIVKVLGTIVQIIIDFTDKFPDVEIFFAGSTPARNLHFRDVRQWGQGQERSKLYFRIVRTYYHQFIKIFTINVLEPKGNNFIERPFDPELSTPLIGFLIKRIH